jgi:hypothetical protein
MTMYDQPHQVVTTQYNADRMAIYTQAPPHLGDADTLAVAERRLSALPLEVIPDPASLPEGSHLPFCRNPLWLMLDSSRMDRFSGRARAELASS